MHKVKQSKNNIKLANVNMYAIPNVPITNEEALESDLHISFICAKVVFAVLIAVSRISFSIISSSVILINDLLVWQRQGMIYNLTAEGAVETLFIIDIVSKVADGAAVVEELVVDNRAVLSVAEGVTVVFEGGVELSAVGVSVVVEGGVRLVVTVTVVIIGEVVAVVGCVAAIVVGGVTVVGRAVIVEVGAVEDTVAAAVVAVRTKVKHENQRL